MKGTIELYCCFFHLQNATSLTMQASDSGSLPLSRCRYRITVSPKNVHKLIAYAKDIFSSSPSHTKKWTFFDTYVTAVATPLLEGQLVRTTSCLLCSLVWWILQWTQIVSIKYHNDS